MDLNPFSRSILPRLRVKMKEPTGKVRVEMNTRSPVPPCPLRQGETTSRTSSPTSSSLWMSECIISHLWVDLLLFSITYLPCSSWPRLRTRRFDPEHLAVWHRTGRRRGGHAAEWQRSLLPGTTGAFRGQSSPEVMPGGHVYTRL